jgi:hypothetical protein
MKLMITQENDMLIISGYHEEQEREYVWQEGQWCPPGLRRSQKRRVQHLRNQELKQAEIKRK